MARTTTLVFVIALYTRNVIVKYKLHRCGITNITAEYACCDTSTALFLHNNKNRRQYGSWLFIFEYSDTNCFFYALIGYLREIGLYLFLNLSHAVFNWNIELILNSVEGNEKEETLKRQMRELHLRTREKIRRHKKT